eukprot:scaffold71928_cov59-Attheya_sp.AAC.1
MIACFLSSFFLCLLTELPTSTVDSATLWLLASVSSRESPTDLEELLSPASLTPTELILLPEIEVGSVLVPTKTDSPLAHMTLADVEVTLEETNPMRKPKAGTLLDTSVECSRLKTIKGMAAVTFLIVVVKATLELVKARGDMKGEKKLKKAMTIIAGPIVIKRKWLCKNVLFLDRVHPQLATRAKENLTKAGEGLF